MTEITEKEITPTIGASLYNPTNVENMSVNIFGWELYRVFRDEKKNIIRIVLVKDNIVREFTFDGEKRLK